MIPLKPKSNLESNHMHTPHFFFSNGCFTFLRLMLKTMIEEKLAFFKTKSEDEQRSFCL